MNSIFLAQHSQLFHWGLQNGTKLMPSVQSPFKESYTLWGTKKLSHSRRNYAITLIEIKYLQTWLWSIPLKKLKWLLMMTALSGFSMITQFSTGHRKMSTSSLCCKTLSCWTQPSPFTPFKLDCLNQPVVFQHLFNTKHPSLLAPLFDWLHQINLHQLTQHQSHPLKSADQ